MYTMKSMIILLQIQDQGHKVDFISKEYGRHILLTA